jgi:hypothetical protein
MMGRTRLLQLRPLTTVECNPASPTPSCANWMLVTLMSVVTIRRDVAANTIQLSTDTAGSGLSLTQPCDVVSTVCDVVATLCTLDATNAGHNSSTTQAHHCNPSGKPSNMESPRTLNHSVVLTPNEAGEQQRTKFACGGPNGQFSCIVSDATYRLRFLLGDMVWNEVLSYIKVLDIGHTNTVAPQLQHLTSNDGVVANASTVSLPKPCSGNHNHSVPLLTKANQSHDVSIKVDIV